MRQSTEFVGNRLCLRNLYTWIEVKVACEYCFISLQQSKASLPDPGTSNLKTDVIEEEQRSSSSSGDNNDNNIVEAGQDPAM